MGEANIRYARGEKEDAILMCMEIIRQGTEWVCVTLQAYNHSLFVCQLVFRHYEKLKSFLCPAAPLAYEPFSTLAMIYEDEEDMSKALQFGLIAAHLNPSDCEEWIRLAEMSLEQDNIQQAIICYSKGQCDTDRHASLPTGNSLCLLSVGGTVEQHSPYLLC